MKRNRVIHGASDTAICQVRLHEVTLFHANCVLMKNVYTIAAYGGHHDPRYTTQEAIVIAGVGSSHFSPMVQVPQLNSQYSSLQLIEPAVPSKLLADVLLRP